MPDEWEAFVSEVDGSGDHVMSIPMTEQSFPFLQGNSVLDVVSVKAELRWKDHITLTSGAGPTVANMDLNGTTFVGQRALIDVTPSPAITIDGSDWTLKLPSASLGDPPTIDDIDDIYLVIEVERS